MIRYASYSDKGGRACNEDTALIRAEGDAVCAVICDGLGGYGGGDRASRKAAEIVTGGWEPGADTGLLTKLCDEAHKAVLAMQTPDCKMKTTIAVLSYTPGNVCYAYAGDSRLYHFEGDTLKFQTKDHSASQIAVMLGQITPEQIRFHSDRNRILRALGQNGASDTESGVLTVGSGVNTFLLCSDGFWEFVLEKEMCALLGLISDPERWLAKMRELHDTRAPANCDNNTAAAVRIE